MKSENIQGIGAVVSQFVLHLHPRKIPGETLRFTLSFGLGGISLTLFALLAGSGQLQLMSYEPTVQQAHHSVRLMYGGANLSGWLRNIHYWSSNILVVSVVLHLFRVLCTGAFGGLRRLNWIVGTFLLLLVLLISFTGYLLPWSQLSYWAVTIFINMAGYVPFAGETLASFLRAGDAAGEIGQGTLSTFFVLHTGWLPFTLIALLALHFWLVRKAGGLVTRDPDCRGPLVPCRPGLIAREAAVAMATIACVGMLAAFFDAPVGEQAMAGVSPNPVKAAWYFMGLQEMLMHFHPSFAVFVFPSLTLIAFISLPFWQQKPDSPGIWFGGRRGRKLALAAALVGGAVAAMLVIFDALWVRSQGHPELQAMASANSVTRGWLPLELLVFAFVSSYLLLTRKKNYLKGEVLTAAWVAVAAGMLVFAITGIWFRGAGMQLILFH